MFTHFIIPTTLAVGILFLFYKYLTWYFDYWQRRGVPGPRPLPLFGNFPSTITGKRNFVYDMDDIYRKYKKQTRFVGVFITRNPQLLILDPSLVKEILITNFKCFQDNESSKWMNKNVEPIAGGNPFVLTGNDWKVKRAEMVAGVTVSKIKGFYPVIKQTCTKLTNYLRANLGVIEAKDLSMRFTGEVVADIVWGIEAKTFEQDKEITNDQCTFLRMSKRMIAQAFKAVSYFSITELFPIIRRFYTMRVFPQITDDFFLQLTEMAMAMRESGNRSGERQDFLQYLIELQQKKNLTTTQIVALMLTFHFDGFETSAALISHCLLMLGRHQHCQDKLRREIQSKLNDEGDIPFEELIKLPYLDQCLSETLRIFVPLASMSKICTESCELTNFDGHRLKLNVGDVCLISAYSFQHDEEFYPEPDSFIPERFAAEENGDSGGGGDCAKKYKDMGVYLPFGDGPRICLGMKFGLAQAKAAVVEIIKNFAVTVNEKTRKDNYQDSIGFIMNLQGGIYLNIKPLEIM